MPFKVFSHLKVEKKRQYTRKVSQTGSSQGKAKGRLEERVRERASKQANNLGFTELDTYTKTMPNQNVLHK